jgi:hypothetical protein
MKRAILAMLLAAIMIPAAWADADSVEFNYNGLVRVEGVAYNGDGYFKFSIVNSDASTTYWANDGATLNGDEPTSSVLLAVSDGFFSVNIGDSETTGMTKLDPSVFHSQDRVYLRVWFSDGVHGFEQLQPDRAIVNPALLASQAAVDALDLYVDGSLGDDDNNGLSPATAKKTIQAAIKTLPARIDGNATVHIAAGVYREYVQIVGITLNPSGALTIVGDPTTVPSTSVDPDVRITGSDDDVTKVRGIGMAIINTVGYTIKGIVFDRCSGYGVTARYSAGTFVNCKSKLNTYDGFECEQGETNFTSCVSQDNGRYGFNLTKFAQSLFSSTTAYHNTSSGAYLEAARVVLIGGAFQSNLAHGIYMVDQSTLTVGTGASFTGNTNYGIKASYGSITHSNSSNSFSGNGSGTAFADTGGGIY